MFFYLQSCSLRENLNCSLQQCWRSSYHFPQSAVKVLIKPSSSMRKIAQKWRVKWAVWTTFWTIFITLEVVGAKTTTRVAVFIFVKEEFSGCQLASGVGRYLFFVQDKYNVAFMSIRQI